MGTRPITFEGQTYTFPADATDQEVSAALGKHVAPTPESALSRFGTGAWEETKGLASGLGGIAKDVLIHPFSSGSGASLINRLLIQPTIEKGKSTIEAGKQGDWAKTILSGLATLNPLSPDVSKLYEQSASGDVAGASGRGAVDIAALLAGRKSPEAVEKVGEIPAKAQGAANEVMGVGKTSEAMKADQIAHAQAVKEHIASVESAVHADAKAGAVRIDSAIDKMNPDGFFEKSGIRMGVKDALGEISKIPEKWPASIGKMLVEDKVTRTTGPAVGGRTMDLSNPNDLAAYQRYKAQGVFTPEEIQRIEGSEKTPNWTMEQMRQLRSDIGRDLGKYENKGAMGAALNNVYRYLTGEMRKAAASVGKEPEFLENNADYKQWVDDFHRSPLKKVLNGQTSGTILKALGDERVQELVSRYEDYGADPEALKQESKRAAIGQTIQRFSRPSKWDLVVAGLSPHSALIRLLVPYLMRNPKVLDTLGGKGLDTAKIIPTNKVLAKRP
jgi:hypothetical protein